MTDLRKLPAFGPAQAECDGCELKEQCDEGRSVLAYRPAKFNGLMVIGEGPGQEELARGRPFIGNSGKLLRGLVSSIGIDLDECYITNATLCKPPSHSGPFVDAFPHAVESCLGRLEAEIAAVKPKVIVTLGAAAWLAISGYDEMKIKYVPFDCDVCDANRKVGPVFECNNQMPNPADGGATLVACGYLHYFKADTKEAVTADELESVKAAGCPKCGSTFKRLRPKMVKCPTCGGKKRKPEEVFYFKQDYTVTKAAGLIFEPAPTEDTTEAYHLGHWLGEIGVKYVIPTFHPAYILRGNSFTAKALQKHLMKARKLLEGVKPLSFKYSTTTDPFVLEEFIARKRPKSGEPLLISADIETEATTETEDGEVAFQDARKILNVTKIKCIGFATRDEALVVDTRDCDPNAEDPLLDKIADVLTDPTLWKVYHNGAGYDVPVIDRMWGVPWDEQVLSYHDDTQFAHTNLYPDEAQTLSHVTSKFAMAHAWKPPRTLKGAEVHGSFEELALYNARDCIHTYHDIEELGVAGGKAIRGGRMDRAGLAKIYEQDSRIRKIAIGMTMRGMPLDQKLWAEAGATAQKHIDDAEQGIRDALKAAQHPEWETFNPNSVPQLRQLLFGYDSFFKLPALKLTKTGPSTDKTVMQELLSLADDPAALKFLQAKLELLQHNYIAKNFVFSASMRPWEDGRLHAMWKPWGAKTGRFTSSPNFQNWPIWLRNVVVAEKGRKIVGADMDQLELRGIAFLSGDPNLIKRCLEADEKRKLEPECDPHSYIASLAFGKKYTGLHLKDPKHNKDPNVRCRCQTCERKALRDICKRVIYGLNYGAGDSTVLEAIYDGGYSGPPITLDMIRLVRVTIFNAFDGVPKWRDEQVHIARGAGELRSPIYGRRRIFPLSGAGDDIPITEIYNYPIQSLGADIMNERIIVLDEGLRDIDETAFIFAQVHDAIYIEADENKAEAVAKFLSETMTTTLELNGVKMPFTASSKITDNWKAAA